MGIRVAWSPGAGGKGEVGPHCAVMGKEAYSHTESKKRADAEGGRRQPSAFRVQEGGDNTALLGFSFARGRARRRQRNAVRVQGRRG